MDMAATPASQALFGRDTEIASIMAFLGRESPSDVGALILSGDAGVGKSALLDEAAGAAAASGYAVIRTAGAEAESEMGFAALTAVVHHIGTDTISAIEPRYAQALEVALGVREEGTPGARLRVRRGGGAVPHGTGLCAVEPAPARRRIVARGGGARG